MPRRPRQWKSRGKRASEAHAKKAIPIDYTTAEAITEQKRLFREKFGREPGPHDPLFFNPESAVAEFLCLNRGVHPTRLCQNPFSLRLRRYA
jgi:hypothetical protein